MIRAPGGQSAPLVDAGKEDKLARQAIVGNTITFAVLCLGIYVAPHILEQFGIESLK